MVLFSKFMMLLLACIAIHYQLAHANSEKDAYLIVGLPLEHKSEPVAIWERGEEILLGAQIAVKNINSRPDVLSGQTLHVVEVDIGKCDQQNNHNFLLQFVNFTFLQDINLIGAVGIFCPTEVQIITQPLGTSRTSIKRESFKSAVKAAYDTELGKPNPEIIRALLEFLEAMEWRNTAAITDTSDIFFFNLVEELHKASVHNGSNINVIVYNYVSNISRLDLPRIILVSVSTPLATELLCSAYKEDLMWPNHVWIFHTYHLLEIANLNVSCDIAMALENVVIIDENIHAPTQFNNGLIYHIEYASYLTTTYKPVIELNWYSNILHDLVWSVVLATNDTVQ